MDKISEITRRDILDIIKEGFTVALDDEQYDSESGKYITERRIYMPYFGRMDTIEFLSRLYNLKEMPSQDDNYATNIDEISKDERFLLGDGNGDEPLLRFICEMLHPAVRNEKKPWKQYLEKFNELLRPDGYELYPAQHISGRDVYKAREYVESDKPLLPDNLFSERYKSLIDRGQGEPVDNISGTINFKTKKRLCKVMLEFREPVIYHPNRYDSYTQTTDALSVAINRFNKFMDCPIIDLRDAVFSPWCPVDELLAQYFTPFILDVIEFQHDELSVGEKSAFQEAVNAVFQKDNVSFRLTDRGLIEQLAEHEVLTSEIITMGEQITELGLRELFDLAVEKHMEPNLQSHKDAIEKLWDVLERLKTYYTESDKRKSVEKIVNDMSGGQEAFKTLFDTEFKALTDVGNKFRIRHHETSCTDITDIRHYDYFFNRCLSLIALAIQYLE